MKIHNPPMKFRGEEGEQNWQKGLAAQTSSYGEACYRYASEWATLMEQQMTEENFVPTIPSLREWFQKNADRLSHRADTEGINGFMYGAAVSILVHCWTYGEELRRWHNEETQIETEGDEANANGGILNPAIICVE